MENQKTKKANLREKERGIACQDNRFVIDKASTAGITLVALVVTIVVLLILAGITLTYILGDNGIIKKAQEAKNKMEEAIANEANEWNEISKWLKETNETDESNRTLTINFREWQTWNLIYDETAKVEIYKDEGCSELFKTVSSSDGVCKLYGADVPLEGEYYLKVVKAPVGYELPLKNRKMNALGVQDEEWDLVFLTGSTLRR